jgi:hypothetical protein
MQAQEYQQLLNDKAKDLENLRREACSVYVVN